MTYTLQQLSDLEDIRTLKHRYFRYIDTADHIALASLFTQDVHVDYRGGGYRVSFDGCDNMVEFIANSLNSSSVAMHHGHMPEIILTGPDSAEGIWYLEDIFINLSTRVHTIGTAIYKDQYRREGGDWKIARTEYDRVFEMNRPLPLDAEISSHHLGEFGRKPEECVDVSHLIKWTA